jgi:hypothetical protein
MHQFERSGERSHLHAAIGAFQQAVDTTAEPDEHARRLSGEAVARLRLYELTDEDVELELAYCGLAAALEHTHDKSPERPMLQIELAKARVYRLPRERLVALLKEEGLTPHGLAGLEELENPPWFSFLGRAVQMLQVLIEDLPEGARERPAALAVGLIGEGVSSA